MQIFCRFPFYRINLSGKIETNMLDTNEVPCLRPNSTTVFVHSFSTSNSISLLHSNSRVEKMSKKVLQQKDVIVKLIVGAGQASPSPPVGPALGSKGVKSMDFCKVRLHSILPLHYTCSRRTRNSTPAQQITFPVLLYQPA